MKENLELLKKLFNVGKLTIKDVNFYEENGFRIVCRAGKVFKIIPPFIALVRDNNIQLDMLGDYDTWQEY